MGLVITPPPLEVVTDHLIPEYGEQHRVACADGGGEMIQDAALRNFENIRPDLLVVPRATNRYVKERKSLHHAGLRFARVPEAELVEFGVEWFPLYACAHSTAPFMSELVNTYSNTSLETIKSFRELA